MARNDFEVITDQQYMDLDGRKRIALHRKFCNNFQAMPNSYI